MVKKRSPGLENYTVLLRISPRSFGVFTPKLAFWIFGPIFIFPESFSEGFLLFPRGGWTGRWTLPRTVVAPGRFDGESNFAVKTYCFRKTDFANVWFYNKAAHFGDFRIAECIVKHMLFANLESPMLGFTIGRGPFVISESQNAL